MITKNVALSLGKTINFKQGKQDLYRFHIYIVNKVVVDIFKEWANFRLLYLMVRSLQRPFQFQKGE